MTLETVSVEPNDQELISRAQRGEAAAFEKLVYRYDQQVLSIANSYTKDRDEAQDIYQEVFIRVYRSIGGFQFRSAFSTWLYRIVTNVCLTHQMRTKNRPVAGLEDDVAEQLLHSNPSPGTHNRPVAPDEAAHNAEISQHIQHAVDELSPQQKLVFTLKHYQGYKLREIADMMDCSEGTIKRYLFTATERIRKRLKKIY
jgi:RNA polymerase sigma-70 factor (ECF subfamily)